MEAGDESKKGEGERQGRDNNRPRCLFHRTRGRAGRTEATGVTSHAGPRRGCPGQWYGGQLTPTGEREREVSRCPRSLWPPKPLRASRPCPPARYGSGSCADGRGELGSSSCEDDEAGARVDEHDGLRRVDGGDEGAEDEAGRRTSQPSGQATT